MSAIPPTHVASALQSAAAQREQARETDTARTAQSEAARRAAAGPDAFLDIEAADTDTQINSDSGGLGSQGRHDAPPADVSAEQVEDESKADSGGDGHIDYSA